MKKDNMVAMILAGGRGSRLYDLTKKVAKPAVYFGGKYRIIDFPLSNCANSDISVVGVLTQYESVLLNSYVSKDQNWGLDAKDAGVFVLPPREKDDTGFGLYRGTADAITQNIDFLDQNEADYVLILSGDHIYKMDYAKRLAAHKAANADCTIAVMEVPLKEASRFGIMNTNEEDIIVEFEEKPAQPKSNLASMGIYIFSYDVLRQYLVEDDQKADSNHDFGKDIIPALLNTGKKCLAYRFEGYWKDVGTIDSLWEANMDLLNPENILDLADPTWKIYTENVNELPQFIGANGVVDNAYITEGCVVDGEVKNSVLFTNVKVEEGAQVVDSVVMPICVVKAGAKLVRCLVQENTIIPEGVELGHENSDKIDLITYKNAKKEG